MSKKPNAPEPVADPGPFTHIGDTHWGKGGRYVVDANGRRVPAPAIADPVVPVTTEKEPING